MVGLSYCELLFEGYLSEVELFGGCQLFYIDGEMVLCQCCYCDYDVEDLLGCIELSGIVEIGDIVYYILIGVDVYDY